MAELDDKVIVTKNLITDVADAIREEMDESDTYTLPTMVEKVHALGQGGGGASNIVAPLFTKSGNTYSCNKTWSEINEIYGGNTMSSLASMPQYIVTYNDNRSMFCDVEQYSEDAFLFSFYMATNSNKSVRIVTLSYENVGQSGTVYFSSDKTIEYQESIEACKFTYNSSTNKYICNKTYAQLWNMFFETSNTKLLTPYVITREGDISNTCRIQKVSMGGGDYLILFQFYIGADMEGGYGRYCNRYFTITVEPDNTIGGAYETTQYQPKLTSSNFRNGIEMVAEYGENKIGLTEEVRKDISTSLMIGNASGSVASIVDGADDIPMKSCMVAIEPLQSGSGDPSPQNERPITGWTECNLTRARKNLFNPSLLLEASGWSVDANGVYSGNAYNLSQLYHHNQGGFPIKFKENTQYTITFQGKCDGTSGTGLILFYSYSDGTSSQQNITASENLQNYTFTSTAGKTVVELNCSYSSNLKTYIKNLMLAEGSSATGYESYQANTYNIEFPSEAGTVYGGTLDVTNGVLTVDRAMVDLTTLNFSYSSQYSLWLSQITLSQAKVIANTTPINGICDSFIISKASGTLPTNSLAVNTSKTVFINNNSNVDAPTGNLCYELETPTTYNLTPTEVKTLLGINNIFADCGDVDVEYTRDATSIINWLISQINLGA